MGLTPSLQTALVRSFLALLCSGAVVGLAVAGIFVTTQTETVSLLLEPFSLLLMPGLLVSLVLANVHDFPPLVVILASFFFYFAFFYTAFWWLAERRARLAARAPLYSLPPRQPTSR